MTPKNSLNPLPVLEIYMVAEGKLWVEVNSPEPVANHLLTRVLKTTFDRSTQVSAKPGERLYYHQPVESSPWQEYLVMPSEWVVTRVVAYQPDPADGSPEFQSVRIAYCEAQPLPEAEVTQLSYTVVPDQVAAGRKADRDAYREFLQTDASKRYVIRHRPSP
ncbi:MAG: hypothetical protein AAF766_09790 [Cyanobacteria bacterium P01_D01_bin.14]